MAEHIHVCGGEWSDAADAMIYNPNEGCGKSWAHDESNMGDSAAHTCPGCGLGPWWSFMNEGEKLITCENIESQDTGEPLID